MSFRTKLVGILLATAFVVGTPLEAYAQGGFWEWIHRMSGPAFKATAGGRFSICLNKTEDRRRCFEVSREAPQPADAGFAPVPQADSVGREGFSLIGDGREPGVDTAYPSHAENVAFQSDQSSAEGGRPDIEWLAGLGVLYGWSGDNLDRQIEDVRMLLLEPNVRLLFTRVPKGSLVAGAGVGFHRFWHGTVPEPFWSTSLVLTAGYRLELLPDEDGLPRLFLEPGVRGRYFFDRPPSRSFGGRPESNADDGELVRGWYFAAGYRFYVFGG